VANTAAEKARERALDPTLTMKEISEVRRAMEDAAFSRDRLQAALPRLSERLKELRAAEEDARRWAAYKKLEVERDAIAEELKEYPALAKRIAAIVERLAANDIALDNLNAYALPTRAPKLRSAELLARNLPSFSPAQFVTIPRIGQQTRLVKFEHDKADPYFFPKPAATMPVDYGAMFPKGDPPPVIEKPQSRHTPNPAQPKKAIGAQSS
jgi:hypothetical protein